MYYLIKSTRFFIYTSQFVSGAPSRKMYPQLNKETERLKTFSNWPLSYPDPKTMAAVGLFYTGVGDVTKCYFCEVYIHRWKQTDCPVSEHLRNFYSCPLLRRCVTNNIPAAPKTSRIGTRCL